MEKSKTTNIPLLCWYPVSFPQRGKMKHEQTSIGQTLGEGENLHSKSCMTNSLVGDQVELAN